MIEMQPAIKRESGRTASRLISFGFYQIENATYVSDKLHYLLLINANVLATPAPPSTLKMGPAIAAVMAISPNPFLVRTTSAVISPSSLPHARKVRVSKAWGRFVMNPKIFSKSTIELAEKLTQAILWVNVKMVRGSLIQVGALFLEVKKIMSIENIIHTAVKMRPSFRFPI